MALVLLAFGKRSLEESAQRPQIVAGHSAEERSVADIEVRVIADVLRSGEQVELAPERCRQPREQRLGFTDVNVCVLREVGW